MAIGSPSVGGKDDVERDGFSEIVPSGVETGSALREALVAEPCGFAVITASQAAL